MVNRLCYACFHAAQAILYSKGFEPATHQAVLSLFGEEVVLTGEASRADGRFLSRLRDLRHHADYRTDPVDADISELYRKAETFVADMSELV